MPKQTATATATAEPVAEAAAEAQAAETAAPLRARTVPPRMGDTVMVRVKAGTKLVNQETGGFFAFGEPTPQTVTVTVLRRLQDGDLELV